MALSAGTRLGPYEILEPLGAGGMGEVYRARDTRLDRTVAVKVLPAELAADPQLKARFEREARAISALAHPNICTLHDVGEQDGRTFLVMEHLVGQTLAERLEKGPLPLDHALEIACQVADALSAAHKQGIVHRDLKPANVMLTKSGARLLDFGLARLTGHGAQPAVESLTSAPTEPEPLTGRGTVMGTLPYMAPEQVEGKSADPRTDLWALGAILYEMLTGDRAFQASSPVSLVGAILEREPTPLKERQPLTPPSLERLVRHCLAKDPDERWDTAHDVADELRWIAQSDPDAPRMQGTPQWMLPALVAAVAAMLIVGVLAGWLWLRPLGSARGAPLVTRLDVVTPPTTSLSSFALSPDGRQLAFVADGESGSQLWIRPLDQVTARPLAGTEGAMYPFWSADGSAIAFFADALLKRIGVAGGPPAVVADAPSTRGGTWGADGVIVYSSSGIGGLMQVNARSGTPMPVTRLTGDQISHRWPRFLPEGRRFLFQALGAGGSRPGIYLGSLDGGEPIRVLAGGKSHAEYTPSGYLLLVSQGVLVGYRFDVARATVSGGPVPVAQSVGFQVNGLGAFSVSATGVLAHRREAEARRQLVWLDRAGNVTGTLGTPEDTVLSEPALAPNGQRLALSRSVQNNIDIWLIDVARGFPRRLTFDPGADMAPIWSPDGSRIVYMSDRDGTIDLFETPANSPGGRQPLLATAQTRSPRDWSPDGRFLLYAEGQGETTTSDLWALPLAGERTPIAVAQSKFDEAQGQFSPDGRWVAYSSNETGRSELWVQPFPATGARWQVSLGGGGYPRWRPDGKELYFLASDSTLMAVPIQADPQTGTLLHGAPAALFATRMVASGTNVFPSGVFSAAQYVVAADGRFLMNVDADTSPVPINVVLNWTVGPQP